MSEEDISRVKEIAKCYSWFNRERKRADFLDEEEVMNLTVHAGDLNEEERRSVKRHIEVTIERLENLPRPAHCAASQSTPVRHEHMDGSGHPRGLIRGRMSVQPRCMGIANIFEALTARNRPHKKGMSLTEALEILGKKAPQSHRP